MTAPHVSLGNTATDVGQGINTFIKGLMEERNRQSQLALQQALIDAKKAELNKPEWNIRPAINPQTGRMEYLRMDDTGRGEPGFTGFNAPEYQMDAPMQDAKGNPLPGTRSRAIPDAPIRQVQTPDGLTPRTPNMMTPTVTGGELTQTITNPGHPSQPGQVVAMPPNTSARPVAPTFTQTEVPGQGTVQGLVPRQGAGAGQFTPARGGDGNVLHAPADQFEVEKAQFASNMARAAQAMESAPPEVVSNVVSRQNLASILSTMPVIGAPAGEAARSLMAVGLTSQEAMWLANFNTFLGFAVPELAGKQMTIQEMRMQSSMFVPLLGESLESQAAKKANVRFRVQAAIQASGSGWQRLIGDQSLSGQIPTEYGGTLTTPPPKKPNRFTGIP